MVIGGRAFRGHGGTAGRALPAGGLGGVWLSVPGVRVSCSTVRLYVVINRVLPGAAWRPGSRQRAIELVQGAAGLPMVSGELHGSTRVRARPAAGRKVFAGQRCGPGGYLMRPPRRAGQRAGRGSGRPRCGRPRRARW